MKNLKRFIWKKKFAFFGLFLIVMLLGGLFVNSSENTSNSTKTAHFSVAASLKEVVEEIASEFHQAYPQYRITLDFGGSGAIRQKVLAGAPIDGVFLASEQDMDLLVAEKAVEEPQKLVANRLVAIKPKDEQLSDSYNLADLLKEASVIAIGEPNSVPAGMYAMEVLEYLQLADDLLEKLVQASDVRQVLSFVASGNADIGFVYATDTAISDQVTVVEVIDADAHSPIIYLSALVSDIPNHEAAAQFQQFLSSPTAVKIYQEYGFEPLNQIKETNTERGTQ